MDWLRLLNPLNWFDWIGNIRFLIEKIGELFGFIKKQMQLNKQKEASDQLKEAADQVKSATTLQEKADAACKIEKVFNPESDCDGKPGS